MSFPKHLAHNLNDSSRWRSEDVALSDSNRQTTFEQLQLSRDVLNGLKSAGFIRPSPIQLQAIPLGRCGLDLIVQSKSGTGKTCVFAIIAFEMLKTASRATQVLILAPTREIAYQIGEVMNEIGSCIRNLRCVTLISGTKLKEDREKLRLCHIAIGTPGRVKQLIEMNLLKTISIRLFVLDEADKLLDSRFKSQIDEIYNYLPENKQIIAASATFPNDLAHFLSRYMRSPAFIRLNADNPALIGITQFYQITPYHHQSHLCFDKKIEPLLQILEKITFTQCLIFSNYQARARLLCDKLNDNNWSTVYISAEMEQKDRMRAISRLKKFKCRILVSTDLTARGIDCENVNVVINMDVPWDCETYLHRIGRAGRFGTRGIAITLSSEGKEFEMFFKIMKDCKLLVEELPQPVSSRIWDIALDRNCSFNFETRRKGLYDHSSSGSSNKDRFKRGPYNYASNTEHRRSARKYLTYKEIKRDYENFRHSKRETPNSSSADSFLPLKFKRNVQEKLPETEEMKIQKLFNEKCSLYDKKEFNPINDNESHQILKHNEKNRDNEEEYSSDDSIVITLAHKDDNLISKQSCNIAGDYLPNTQDSLNLNPYSSCDTSTIPPSNDSNQLSKAVFPSIEMAEPREITYWFHDNRYIWKYLVTPFKSNPPLNSCCTCEFLHSGYAVTYPALEVDTPPASPEFSEDDPTSETNVPSNQI